MGLEVRCQIDRGTESFSGRALLESDHLILRGPTTRLILRFSEIQTATADEGLLSLTTPEEVILLHLGAAAAKWLDRIKNPRTRMEKLGVRSGDRVGIHGEIDPDFLAELRARAAEFPESGPFDWIFLAVENPSQLPALHDPADQIAPAGAV